MSNTSIGGPDVSPEGIGDDLLVALTCMAERSKRGQADVGAALNGAHLAHLQPGRVDRALEDLERSGFVEDVLRLFDGGILIRVTPAGKVRAQTLLAQRATSMPPHPEAL